MWVSVGEKEKGSWLYEAEPRVMTFCVKALFVDIYFVLSLHAQRATLFFKFRKVKILYINCAKLSPYLM